jgi:hypothetical protein
MSDVVAIPGCGAATADQARAYRELNAVIADAVDAAKNAGVAQGLIVALLHGLAHLETQTMMDSAA